MIHQFLTITERPRTSWLLVAGWVATAFFLSSLSGEQTPKTDFFIPNLDKLVHFLLYCGGAIALARALNVTFSSMRRVVIVVVCIGLLALYGLSDEYHQTFVPGRSGADIGDWLADVAGAIVGAVSYFILIHHARTKRS